MPIEREDLKELLEAVAASGMEEFVLETAELTVRLRKEAVPPGDGTVAAGGGSRPATERDRGTARPVAAPPPERATDGLVAVTAPMIGTFYRAPEPGAAPFVEIGTEVAPDDTVCIVEVMKLMNGVRAGCRGRVAKICVENATLVEYGQTLVLIEPMP
jgi:acetyl-CoA carboxylase biotin carboxyl carrier protein